MIEENEINKLHDVVLKIKMILKEEKCAVGTDAYGDENNVTNRRYTV